MANSEREQAAVEDIYLQLYSDAGKILAFNLPAIDRDALIAAQADELARFGRFGNLTDKIIRYAVDKSEIPSAAAVDSPETVARMLATTTYFMQTKYQSEAGS